jgi:hypothetical protein
MEDPGAGVVDVAGGRLPFLWPLIGADPLPHPVCPTAPGSSPC